MGFSLFKRQWWPRRKSNKNSGPRRPSPAPRPGPARPSPLNALPNHIWQTRIHPHLSGRDLVALSVTSKSRRANANNPKVAAERAVERAATALMLELKRVVRYVCGGTNQLLQGGSHTVHLETIFPTMYCQLHFLRNATSVNVSFFWGPQQASRLGVSTPGARAAVKVWPSCMTGRHTPTLVDRNGGVIGAKHSQRKPADPFNTSMHNIATRIFTRALALYNKLPKRA